MNTDSWRPQTTTENLVIFWLLPPLISYFHLTFACLIFFSQVNPFPIISDQWQKNGWLKKAGVVVASLSRTVTIILCHHFLWLEPIQSFSFAVREDKPASVWGRRSDLEGRDADHLKVAISKSLEVSGLIWVATKKIILNLLSMWKKPECVQIKRRFTWNVVLERQRSLPI